MIIDLHCHPTIYPFYSGQEVSSARKIKRRKESPIINYSQSDFQQLIDANVPAAVVSLYPIEQGFFTPNTLKTSLLADELIHYLLDFPKEQIDLVQSANHNYFYTLQRQYTFLLDIEKRSFKCNNRLYSFKIISDYADYFSIQEENVKSETNTTIALFLSVEGAHALGCGTINQLGIDPDNLSDINTQALLYTLKKNITTMKQWGHGKHVPLYITFAHHFNNLLCGHQISFAGGIHHLLDQTAMLNNPFTELGKFVIGELLSSDNGKPILVDTRHMSIQARQWYYAYLDELKKLDIFIPVISSHSSANGYATMSESIDKNATHALANEKYNSSNLFNNWDINLSDEEIIYIHRSKGLIGLNFDERVIAGKRALAQARDINTPASWMQLFVNNIMYIAKTIHLSGVTASASFDSICIGSDFDGIINPVAFYNTTSSFTLFEEELRKSLLPLLSNEFHFNTEQASEIVSKICYKNTDAFILRNRG